jgi:hypothetical protein
MNRRRGLAGPSGISFGGEESFWEQPLLWYCGDAMRREKFYFCVISLLHCKNRTPFTLEMDATYTVSLP